MIMSVGYIPHPLAGEDAPNVHVIGDASRVKNLKTVIRAAWDVAYEI